MASVPTLSSDQILQKAGAFVNGEAVGLPLAAGPDQFHPLPHVIKELLARVAALEAEVVRLKSSR